jgi:hypothetical protein
MNPRSNITSLSYLVLSVACLLVCWNNLTTFLAFPTGSQVSQADILSQDIPSFAICPQPTLNLSAIKDLEGFSQDKLIICQDPLSKSNCSFMETFGSVIKAFNINSSQVEVFYKDLKLNSPQPFRGLATIC